MHPVALREQAMALLAETDIDLLVVSPQFDTTVKREWINHLWRTAARTDSRIEPVPCGQQQWQHDTSSQIIEIARREGHEIVAVP